MVAPDAIGQFHGPLVRAVADPQTHRVPGQQVFERDLAHFSGADHEDRLVVEAGEDLPGEVDGHTADADSAGGDGRSRG